MFNFPLACLFLTCSSHAEVHTCSRVTNRHEVYAVMRAKGQRATAFTLRMKEGDVLCHHLFAAIFTCAFTDRINKTFTNAEPK